MQLSMRHLMLNRKLLLPEHYHAYAGCLVSYSLPLLRHCFILCVEQQSLQPDHQVKAFFLAEAERLAQKSQVTLRPMCLFTVAAACAKGRTCMRMFL